MSEILVGVIEPTAHEFGLSNVYAVLKTGGLLGSHHHYPVQWGALRYDPKRQAYEIEMTLDDLRTGPSEFDGDAFDWGDRSRPYHHPQYWTV